MKHTVSRCVHCGQLVAYRHGVWIRIRQTSDWYPEFYDAEMCASMAYADNEEHEGV